MPSVFRTSKEFSVSIVLNYFHLLYSAASSYSSSGSAPDELWLPISRECSEVLVDSKSNLSHFSPLFISPHCEYLLKSCGADAETKTS